MWWAEAGTATPLPCNDMDYESSVQEKLILQALFLARIDDVEIQRSDFE